MYNLKTIKVYCLPSHQTTERHSGVDFARVNSPMKYLNGFEYKGYRFETTIHDVNNETEDDKSWLEIAKKYDLVFFNYTVVDWHYAVMASYVHGKGKKIIMDCDDDLWHVQSDNIVYNQLQELKADYILTCICDDVDGVTTTNGYLRNVIADKSYKYHDKIKVIDNHIDLTLYNRVFPAKDTGTITLMHYGSSSHFEDLLDPEFLKAMDRIMAEYPNVVFKCIQSFISELRYRWGERYINAYGDIDIYRWVQNKFPQFMEEADIMVVPLRDTIYNRAKSSIKFRETASAMKPGVFSATRPYLEDIEHGKTGFLVKTADEWYTAIKLLIDSKDKRDEIGENAYNYVKKECQIQNHVQEYADFFLKILSST